MSSKLLRYRLESGPGGFTKIYAAIIIAAGVYVITASVLAGLVLIAIGIFPFLLYKCLEFDLYKGSYCMGLNFAGYTLGEKEPFLGVEYVYLKRNKTIHRSHRRNWASTYSVSYDGFLLLSDGVKLPLVQEDNKEAAMQALEQVARDLQTSIRDLTTPGAI